MNSQADLLNEIEAEFRETARWTGRTSLSQRVAAVLRKVTRELFVPAGSEQAAYENRPLSIGHGQTISQPFIVALMTELLDLEPEHKVLEIGTGSGYQAAVLAELGGKVYSIEVIPELAARAGAVLAAEGYFNIELRTGDGGTGWAECAPFDRIIVTAAARDIPPALLDQLRHGGRLVIPVGPPHDDQQLLLVTKDAAGRISRQTVLSVAFVPLTSAGAD